MELLAGLTRRFDVEVFIEDQRSLLAAPQWAVFHHEEFSARDRHRRFDQCLYELGNNRLHWFVYRAALTRPGVLDLHEALLQHLFLGQSWEAWEQEFAFVYGARGREIAANLKGGNMGAHEGFFRYPLAKKQAAPSSCITLAPSSACNAKLRTRRVT